MVQIPAPPAPTAVPKFRLGELLMREGLITTEQLQRGLEEQRAFGGRLGRHLVELGVITEAALLDVLSRQLRIPLVDLDAPDAIAADARRYARADLAEQWGFCPILFDARRNVLVVAVSEPDPQLLSSIEGQLGLRVEPRIAPSESIERAARRLFYGDLAPPVSFAGRKPSRDVDVGPPSLSDELGPPSQQGAFAPPAPPGYDAQLAQQMAIQQFQLQQMQLQAQQLAAAAPAVDASQLLAVREQIDRLEKALGAQSRVLRALAELLIEKGAFTMAEFARKQSGGK